MRQLKISYENKPREMKNYFFSFSIKKKEEDK